MLKVKVRQRKLKVRRYFHVVWKSGLTLKSFCNNDVKINALKTDNIKRTDSYVHYLINSI